MKLSEQWTEHLKGQPETGMGYQIVDVHFKDGHVETDVVVMNCEETDIDFDLDAVENMIVKERRNRRSRGR